MHVKFMVMQNYISYISLILDLRVYGTMLFNFVVK